MSILTGKKINLLVLFGYIMEEGSLVSAADRLSISQSTASYQLGLLRAELGDVLFKRKDTKNKGSFEPTPFASEFYRHVKPALEKLETAYSTASNFDYTAAEKTFTIGATDLFMNLFSSRILDYLSGISPDICVNFESISSSYNPKLLKGAAESLAGGIIDIAIQSNNDVFLDFKRELILKDRWIGIKRKEGKNQIDTPFDLEQCINDNGFIKLGYPDIDMPILKLLGKNHHLPSPMTSSLSSIPELVISSGMVSVIPLSLLKSRSLNKSFFDTFDIDIELPPLELYMYWRPASKVDDSISFLKETIREVTQPFNLL